MNLILKILLMYVETCRDGLTASARQRVVGICLWFPERRDRVHFLERVIPEGWNSVRFAESMIPGGGIASAFAEDVIPVAGKISALWKA